MKINIRFSDSDGNNCESKNYDLNGDEIRSILLCDGIGHNGSYYKIYNKIFEDGEDGYSVAVIAAKDSNGTA